MKDNDKKPTPMGEHFDLSEAYAREAQPLVEKLHEWCVENKVPVVASVVYSNDDRKIAQHMMNAFFGVERTPPGIHRREAGSGRESHRGGYLQDAPDDRIHREQTRRW